MKPPKSLHCKVTGAEIPLTPDNFTIQNFSDEILYYHCFKCLCNRTHGDAPLDDNCWEKREDR